MFYTLSYHLILKLILKQIWKHPLDLILKTKKYTQK